MAAARNSELARTYIPPYMRTCPPTCSPTHLSACLPTYTYLYTQEEVIPTTIFSTYIHTSKHKKMQHCMHDWVPMYMHECVHPKTDGADRFSMAHINLNSCGYSTYLWLVVRFPTYTSDRILSSFRASGFCLSCHLDLSDARHAMVFLPWSDGKKQTSDHRCPSQQVRNLKLEDLPVEQQSLSGS